MKDRKIIVYISLSLIIVVSLLAFYFFLRKPVRTSQPKSIQEKRVVVFKDVKYSGEKKGIIDWEIKADMARHFIDRPVVEIEGIDGQYKPKPDVVVYFNGKKGIINTEEEKGTVDEVSINYKKEYTLKSRYMDFDFKKGITSTDAPIDIRGERLTLRGIGLIAKTDEETVRIKKDISGFVETNKGRFKFESDTFLYMLKENQFILDGKVVMKGETLNLLCKSVSIKSKGSDIEMVEATGKVRLISKGNMAYGEKAVYYFKDDIVTLTGSPKLVRENVEMDGDSITYDMKKGRFNVNMPRVRIERR
ncbi:MAG: LPS export ABC transporter periplasmic protein LptC [Syntrophorhabdaceae bacterium]|nr:LPS export ABC transporter periplasmic protein LptC [Syntrophorhabdaceae bacterium]